MGGSTRRFLRSPSSRVTTRPSSRVRNILVSRAPLPPLRPPGQDPMFGLLSSRKSLTSQEISPRRATFELFRNQPPPKEIVRNLGPRDISSLKEQSTSVKFEFIREPF